jgi:hypothetical protein
MEAHEGAGERKQAIANVHILIKNNPSWITDRPGWEWGGSAMEVAG